MKSKYPSWSLRIASVFILAIASSSGPALAEVLPAASEPDPHVKARVAEAYGKLPLSFEANQGQTDPRVKFTARGGDYTLFLTSNEAVLALGGRRQGTGAHGAFVRMKLLRANPASVVSGMDELSGKSNYFIGNDLHKWKTNVPNYTRVRYGSIYPGIDLAYYGKQGQLEYDFEVAPGTNPAQIKLDITAGQDVHPSPAAGGGKRAYVVTPLRIAANGDLVVSLNGDEVRFHKPVVYQEADAGWSHSRPSSGVEPRLQRQYREARYVLGADNYVTFQLGAYDRTKALVIDPVLTYSSVLGGSFSDEGHAIAVDSSGNAYVTGTTSSLDFPRVNQASGACLGTCGLGPYSDVFVTKISAAGDAMVYSSYLGGSGGDIGYGITVDSSANVYLTGRAGSFDFPRVNQIPGGCNGSCGNGFNYDVFVTKISAAGDAVVYSSLLGGSDEDSGGGIALDVAGSAYLTGVTISDNFPRMNQISGACQGSCGSGSDYDAYVIKINATGNRLVYSSLLGGSGQDYGGQNIVVDGSGSAYLTGPTDSTDFPRVNQISGACQGTCGSGSEDAFVTKVNAAGSALVYSSLLGGSGQDDGSNIAVDGSGNVYLTGRSSSSDFPRVNQISGACRGTCGSGNSFDIFISKINVAGSALVFSSLLGGGGDDEGTGIAVDGSGNVYVAGGAESVDFPRVNQIPGACNGSCGSGTNADAFVTKISAAGNALIYSSLLGGSGDENGGLVIKNSRIVVDRFGSAYMTGSTESPDFPRVNQISGACLGGCSNGFYADAFAMKISPSSNVALNPRVLKFTSSGIAKIVVLTSAGELPLLIESIVITGTDRADFELSNNCPISPNTLAPEDHCTITVGFNANGGGQKNANLTITDDAPDSPQTVSLAGIGESDRRPLK